MAALQVWSDTSPGRCWPTDLWLTDMHPSPEFYDDYPYADQILIKTAKGEE